MNRLTFVIVCLLYELGCFQTLAQHSRMIKIPAKYSQEGVIFDSTYSVPFKLNGLKQRITPSIKEISIAESIIEKYYDNILANYYRQYLGYEDAERHKIIVIQLINSKIKRRQHIYIEPWKYEFLVGFGGFYEANTEVHSVDITNAKIIK